MCVCIYVHVYVLVTQSCLTICDTMGCSLPGSSLHGILQVRRLEWVAILFSRGSFPTQESNLCLLHCKHILYHLSHKGSLYIYIYIYIHTHTHIYTHKIFRLIILCNSLNKLSQIYDI